MDMYIFSSYNVKSKWKGGDDFRGREAYQKAIAIVQALADEGL